ncbi:MAG: hypothetical protein WAO35_06365 [Terriglobia bacterium]
MSLTKKPTMTKKRVAANQANGKLSHGPATPEGRGRIRAANIRHGFYSQAEAVALTCLGEDPAELERLRQNLHDEKESSRAMRKELADHLVQVVWRWKRAGRQQEGMALRLAKDANLTREDRVHAHMMRLKMTEESLRLLAQSVAREHYVTTPADLEMMKGLHQEGVVKEMAEIALALFCQLQAPGGQENSLDEFEKARLMVAQAKEIFGIGMSSAFAPPADVAPDFSPAPADLKVGATKEENDERYPRITAAEWEARERPRHLLENILNRQVEICEAQRLAILKESLAGPSPYERAAEIALVHPDAALMQRMEESSFRQIWRITTLLLKIERTARDEQSTGTPPETRDIYEIKAS